jgi:hypothetical protein
MNQYLVITIDVEPDCTPNWRYSNPLTFFGVHEGIVSRLQPLFNKYNIIPTYLINNVVLEDPESIATFKKLHGNYELGTHLHPEFIEPEKQFSDYAGKKGEANCCFYRPEIEFEKIKNITQLFGDQFDYQPTSFRAGRFSAGTNTVKSLKQLGYKVDTSVTPYIKWSDHSRERPVDFRRAPNQPYWTHNDSITEVGSTPDLLEVPVSITLEKLGFIEFVRHALKTKKLPFDRGKPLWLRPVYSRYDQFIKVMEVIKSHFAQNPFIVYNMMFHNVEVMPGLSPYSKTEEDCKRYLESLEKFLQYCNKHNVQSIPLSALYDIYKK